MARVRTASRRPRASLRLWTTPAAGGGVDEGTSPALRDAVGLPDSGVGTGAISFTSRRGILALPGERQVSKIENGDLDSTKVGTIRGYLEAVGGEMAIEYVIGDAPVQVA